jgi:uncharacterized protein YbjT (DUF2867 family)
MILILGATGRIGTHLVRELVQSGANVRALVRNPERATRLEPACQLVRGDIEDADSLCRALEGVRSLFLLCKESSRLPAHERNAIAAAREAGVAHVVKLSSWGAAADAKMEVARAHAEGEESLRRSGLTYTLLRPNYFMNNLAANLPQVRETGRLRVPMGQARISMIDVRDIAAVAARVLREAGHEGKVYELSGPTALRFSDVAKVLSEALGKPVVYEDVPPEETRRELLALGLPAPRVDTFLNIYEAYRGGVGEAVTPDVERLLGRPPRTLAQFFQDELPRR